MFRFLVLVASSNGRKVLLSYCLDCFTQTPNTSAEFSFSTQSKSLGEIKREDFYVFSKCDLTWVFSPDLNSTSYTPDKATLWNTES